MFKQKLTLSALSAMLMCIPVHAQLQVDTLYEVEDLPQAKYAESWNWDYRYRTQRNAGIPTVYIDILDGVKSDGVLETFGVDYKYDANNNIIYETNKNGEYKLDENGDKIPKTNGYKYKIGTYNGDKIIYNSLISRDKNCTRYATEDRWTNYYQQTYQWNSEAGYNRDRNYDIARIQVIDASGGMKERDEFVRVRGRGNSTWRTRKVSFRLKFPNKTALLAKGDGTNEHADSKTWTLLANAFDKSLIRNAIASEIGKEVGLPFNVSYKFVDLYINNEYWGCYQIGDQIAIGGRRIDIDEDEGWLMEAVASREEFTSQPYISPNIQGLAASQQEYDVINVKNPEVENDNPNDAKIQAIKNWFNQINFADHWENTGFRKYVDINSFVDYLIVLDISGNYDGTIQNYMYRDKGENSKLMFGPIWDNDLAFGNFWDDTTEKLQRVGIKENKKTRFSNMIDAAMNDAVFMKALKRKWDKVYPGMKTFIANKVNEIVNPNEPAIESNNNRWPTDTAIEGGEWVGGTAPDYGTAIYRINQYTNNHLPYVNTQYTNSYNALKTNNTFNINATTTNASTNPFSTMSNKLCKTYIQNRSFTANEWSTICLPCNLDEDELKQYFGNEMKLAEYARLEGGMLLVFTPMEHPSLEAGVPYLIKPSQTVSNPVFTDVVLSINQPRSIKIKQSDAVSFNGTFYKTNINQNNSSTLQGNDFYKATSATIDGISAYVSGSTTVSLLIEGEEPPFIAGDVNDDGIVDILDLNILISYLLGNQQEHFNTNAADLSGDDKIDILDMNKLINLLLSQK